MDEHRHAQADHVGRQMVAVAERLCREIAPGGGTAAESIREQVRAARDAFSSPQVIGYLPTLVERAVRCQVRFAHADGAEAASNGRKGSRVTASRWRWRWRWRRSAASSARRAVSGV